MPVESGPTHVPAALAEVRARLPRLAPAGVQRVLRASTTSSCRCDKGDAAFFNPALFHGAGHNRSADIRRMANLLQISSAFGRAMETVDRDGCANARLPGAAAAASGRCAADEQLRNVDRRRRRGLRVPDQPRPRPADRRARPPDPGRAAGPALAEGWEPTRLRKELGAYADRRRTDDV